MALKPLTVGSLFAGIGGFDLGLERTGGFEVKWQVEVDEYCRRVLEKHWPNVKRYGDIRTVSDVERVDVLCGGFPCQPVSLAGERLGQSDERWLWPEFERIIRMVRPRYVLVENTPGLLSLGMGNVFGDLAAMGFDAEWTRIPASAFGAPHIRERVWIVAYPHDEGLQERLVFRGIQGKTRCNDDWQDASLGAWWATEPSVVRVVHGIPGRVGRIKALGNAVVPQIVEWIGNRILEYERRIT